MATATLRPNGTNYNSGWTIAGGAGSAHAATSDSNDATYVSPTSSTWFLVFDIGPLTLPAYAQIRSVSVRVRRLGNSSARLDVAVGYQPPRGSFQAALLSAGEKPSSTITTKAYGSLVTAPGGAAWDNSVVVPNLVVTLGGNSTSIRVHEVYVDVEYDQAPTVVITSPVGTVSGSQVPDIQFGYSDTEGNALERIRAKVYTATQAGAAGFGPDVSTAFWDSGEVLSAASSVAVDMPLPAGDYQVYVKVADAGSGGRYGPWASADFTMGGNLPAVPTLSVSTNSGQRRHELTVVQQDNRLTFGQSTMAADNGEGDGWYADNNTTLASAGSTAPTATTLTETFTGANGALSAANTDINWTVVKGSFAVSSNQLTSADDGTILPSVIRADTALPSVDHFAQVVVNTLSTVADRSVHLMLRMAGSGYAGIAVELNQQNNRFAVWEALTATTGRPVSGFRALPKTLALPATWRAEVSGNQVYVFIQMFGDTSMQFLGQWTTSISTGTQVGLGLYNGGSTSLVDSFTAGDAAPVVSGSSGDWLLEMTATAARQARAFSGGRYAWGAPVTPGEQLTVVGSAWQKANAARSCRIDVEYATADETPLANSVFSDGWTGSDGALWDTAKWTSAHAGAATDTIQSNRGRLTTGAVAYSTPARMYATGMGSITDCEVVVLCVPSSTSAEMRASVCVRGNGSWSGPNPGHPAQGYWAEVSPDFSAVFLRVQDGSSTVLATVSITIPVQGVWVRLRAHGTTLALKAWAANLQEPAVWGWVGQDSTFTGSGKIALTGQNGADAAVRTWDFDDLAVDDLAFCNFGSLFTTSTSSALTEHSRNVVVPAGAVSANVVLVAFPTGAGEVFVWDRVGLMPGAGRSWARGGLATRNLYGPNASSFEVAAAGAAGWTASTAATVTRATYAAPLSGAALDLSWSGTSGFPTAVFGYGPAVPAVAGNDYAVRAWLWRISALTSLLRTGVRFLDSSQGELAVSLGADVLPAVGAEWAAGSHAARAPDGTAYVQAVYAATAVQLGSAAITRVHLVEAATAPTVYQPGPAAHAYARVEYESDDGVTWERVRGTITAYYDPDTGTVVVYDNEAPAGRSRRYRASTAAVDYYVDSAGGATVVSEPSIEVSAMLGADGFWLRDPLVPSRLIRLWHAGDLDHVSDEPQQVFQTLGRANPVVVSDVVRGEVFTWPLVFTSAADYRQFEELRGTGGVLLFQSDFGDQWYVRLGAQRRTVLKRSSDRATTPVRQVEISATQVDRPDPDEDNSGIVTGTVWETV